MPHIHSESTQQAPHTIPDPAGDEEALVAVEITKPTGDQDECPDGEGVGGGEPGELAGLRGDGEGGADCVEGGYGLAEGGLREELGCAEDCYEGCFSGEGGWVLDVALDGVERWCVVGGCGLFFCGF